MTKRSHLPTALGPTLPSPKRGDREAEEEGGATVESDTVHLWEAEREESGEGKGMRRRVGARAVRPCGPAHMTRQLSGRKGDRPRRKRDHLHFG